MTDERKHPRVQAGQDRWSLLGRLLEARRRELGYQYRTQFERARGVHPRMCMDIENAYAARIGTWPPETIRDLARAYQVTTGSVFAVLAGEADTLAEAPPAALPVLRRGWRPPVADQVSGAATWPYFDRIWGRVRALAARGMTDPDGAAVFIRAGGDPRDFAGIGSAADARDWDGAGARLDLLDRVWLIADLQRRDAARRDDGPAAAPGA